MRWHLAGMFFHLLLRPPPAGFRFRRRYQAICYWFRTITLPLLHLFFKKNLQMGVVYLDHDMVERLGWARVHHQSPGWRKRKLIAL